ncbi:hypothetical protein CDAR_582461 [Caerostris darwini]|uniref:Uncharacterized protein n=1 Tax=Caerostris darwini TaxID=1538125 RepID=A0AAV4RLC8_9ARAC|nr:hypothetical protein CDAR_582461 [Caerostris darwini]
MCLALLPYLDNLPNKTTTNRPAIVLRYTNPIELPGKRRLELEAVQRLVVDKVSSKEMHASNESFIFSSSHSRVKTRSPFATHNRLLCFNRLCFRKHFPESASNRVQQHFGKKR